MSSVSGLQLFDVFKQSANKIYQADNDIIHNHLPPVQCLRYADVEKHTQTHRNESIDLL